jgi:hypothetical protein
MSDILDRIDTAIEGRCACGCGTQLDPNGPSAWFATESCQRRWNRPRVVVLSNGVDLAALEAAARALNARLVEVFNLVRPVFDQIGRSMAEAVRQLAPLRRAAGHHPEPPTGLQEHALWHVRNRHTGPPARLERVSRIDPPGGLQAHARGTRPRRQRP